MEWKPATELIVAIRCMYKTIIVRIYVYIYTQINRCNLYARKVHFFGNSGLRVRRCRTRATISSVVLVRSEINSRANAREIWNYRKAFCVRLPSRAQSREDVNERRHDATLFDFTGTISRGSRHLKPAIARAVTLDGKIISASSLPPPPPPRTSLVTIPPTNFLQVFFSLSEIKCIIYRRSTILNTYMRWDM